MLCESHPPMPRVTPGIDQLWGESAPHCWLLKSRAVRRGLLCFLDQHWILFSYRNRIEIMLRFLHPHGTTHSSTFHSFLRSSICYVTECLLYLRHCAHHWIYSLPWETKFSEVKSASISRSKILSCFVKLLLMERVWLAEVPNSRFTNKLWWSQNHLSIWSCLHIKTEQLVLY